MIWFKTKVEAPTDLCCVVNPIECYRCKGLQSKCVTHFTKDPYKLMEIRLNVWCCDNCQPANWNKIGFTLNLAMTFVNVALAIHALLMGHILTAEVSSLCAAITLVCAYRMVNEV